MRVMIDTCVSMDLIQKRKEFFEDAKIIFEAIKDEKIEGYITVKSLMDIHYVTKHILHDETAVRTMLQNLITILKLTDSLSKDAIAALNSATSDYEDAMMIESSKSLGMDYIITRNINDYKKSSIPAITPNDFIKLI